MHVRCTQICQVVWKLCVEMHLHPTCSVTVTKLNFMKLVLAGQHVLGNTLTVFHENSTSCLVDETRLQT